MENLLSVTVGASVLAKDVNDNAYCVNVCGALWFFASKLAPIGDHHRHPAVRRYTRRSALEPV
ncbi:hypothetical protein C1Y18_20260 [Pseudomonas sp. MPR-R5A]|uniref:Uncharacterized protein n=1 Tax=Pseudomonas veronii TaxID=76761 RepID=A0A5M8ERT7_PSEVE|nr:hypothetical protein F3K53_21370 [Pseudomonas veronii]PMX12166.1 hypothetical protein C1Y25_19945 [Pseudomonas sp. MPBC4-3]PMX24868.1 hypothetical protein C1Y23_15305 [Pseudomonas sp. GW460-12]PMX32933.1 hypothetical protein C1Y24_18975 [Pseudomonas sp. MPR-R2A4]PMX40076.1 hypothetical protein C1Y26_15820 [Pseudomonas sp. MPR-R2A7]PMX45111.1 hypothetical protein C1Y20_22075 [Pseudomonas sp. FW301-21B01]PMX52485.1 hypothetical protein C1Y17_18365 [Pseudomonas sp. MPR-R2A6]PMX92463.1 hypoth